MRAALSLSAALLLALTSGASATFPGRNGGVAFSAYELNEGSTDALIQHEYLGFAPLRGRAGHLFGLDAVEPAVSPSGRRIADADTLRGGIWLTWPGCRWPRDRRRPMPCSRLRRLTGFRDDRSPAWSPDGKRVAFVRGTGIHTVAAAGGDRRVLMRGGEPDWSAKGDIAFRRGGIRVRAAGGGIRILTKGGDEPSWSPSGDRIAFAGDKHWEGLQRGLRERMLGNAETFLGIERTLESYRPDDATLAAIAMPVQVLLSEQSHLFIAQVDEWLAARLGVAVSLTPGTHTPYHDHPHELAETIRSFLRRAAKSSERAPG